MLRRNHTNFSAANSLLQALIQSLTEKTRITSTFQQSLLSLLLPKCSYYLTSFFSLDFIRPDGKLTTENRIEAFLFLFLSLALIHCPSHPIWAARLILCIGMAQSKR